MKFANCCSTKQEDPPDVILELVFQYLDWKSDLLSSVELVSKRWRRIAASDTVCKDHFLKFCTMPVPHAVLHLYYDIQVQVHPLWIEFVNEECQRSPHRPYKEIFLIGCRLVHVTTIYETFGPNAAKSPVPFVTPLHGETLREILTDESPFLAVVRSVNRLRKIFVSELQDDQPNQLSKDDDVDEDSIAIMKKRLLKIARNDPNRKRMFVHYARIGGPYGEDPYICDEEGAHRRAKRYLADFLTSLGGVGCSGGDQNRRLFRTSSLFYVFTLDQLQRLLQMGNSTIRPEPEADDTDRDWPAPPKLTLGFLLRSYFPWDEADDLYQIEDDTREWWSSLTKEIQQALTDIYDGYRRMDPDYQASEPNSIPFEAIVEIATNSVYRNCLLKRIWVDILPQVTEILYVSYRAQLDAFVKTIASEYACLYGSERIAEDEKDVAKKLLDIILTIAPDCEDVKFDDCAPSWTKAYQDSLFSNIKREMTVWDEHLAAVAADHVILSDAKTFSDICNIERRFCASFKLRGKGYGEYYVPSLERGVLYNALTRGEVVPKNIALQTKMLHLKAQYYSTKDQHGYYNFPIEVEKHESVKGVKDALMSFHAYSTNTHVKEHALLALLPLLHQLTINDSKKFIYAMYVDDRVAQLLFSECKFYWDIPCAQSTNISTLFEEAMNLAWGSMPIKEGHGLATRLFSVPLPPNIFHAMAEFVLDCLFSRECPSSFHISKTNKGFQVLQIMITALECNVEHAPIVHQCIQLALENALCAIETFEFEQMSMQLKCMYQEVVNKLIKASQCFRNHQIPNTF